MSVALGSCRSGTSPEASARQGRLSFRPRSRAARREWAVGRSVLPADGGDQPAEVYVPSRPEREPLRLVLVLHGAGGNPAHGLDLLREEADRHRLLLVAPKSSAATWDVIVGGYGADVRTVDRLLTEATRRCPVRGYTVAGFSDGASYALSLGLANGDVFDSVIAFSPGFEAAELANGEPRFFVSHGTQDRVLPIERCSRRIVPALRDAGYDVTYEEFSGGHAVPRPVRRSAAEWLGPSPAA